LTDEGLSGIISEHLIKGDHYENHLRTHREVSRKMATKRARLLDLDSLNSRKRLWADKKAWEQGTDLCPSSFLFDSLRRNSGWSVCVPYMRQPQMCKAKPFVSWRFKTEYAGHADKGQAFMRGKERHEQADGRNGFANSFAGERRIVSNEDSKIFSYQSGNSVQNSSWRAVGACFQETIPERKVATFVECNDYLGGFGIVHTAADQCRIVMWDSAK
jgi:hypothetical protein